MSAEYNDALTVPSAFRQLWAQVLLVAIDDAIKGPARGHMTRTQRLIHIHQARDYLTKANRDFIEVCSLAGLEPEAVRERAVALIEQAPSADELAGEPAQAPKRRKKVLH